MDEEFIISKGWEKSSWYRNGFTAYIHKKFNIVNDGFFIEMKIFNMGKLGLSVEIYEEDSPDKERIFRGELKTNEDLEKIMELLEFDFDMNDK